MSTSYKRTNWVRRLEDFSEGAASGLRLGQWLQASLLALFTGISRCFQPSVPMGVKASIGDLPVRLTGFETGAGASPSSIWHGVVFVALIVSLMTMGRVAQAENLT
ncbi:MAG: hypothetical protein KAI83_04310 [Thiomargarita sp.]|nr:hypothetical protein [Thiomargarita sp.]